MQGYYLLDGDQTVAVVKDGMVDYWNIVANGVAGMYELGSGNKFYYIKDHLGSTLAVVNASGLVVEAHDYYPFGLLMPGRTYQSGSETELDYFGARYYSPALGRWLTVDPLVNKHLSWSPYSYVFANPSNAVDTDGKDGFLVRLAGDYAFGLGPYKRGFFKGSINDLKGTSITATVFAASELGITGSISLPKDTNLFNLLGGNIPKGSSFYIGGAYGAGAFKTVGVEKTDSFKTLNNFFNLTESKANSKSPVNSQINFTKNIDFFQQSANQNVLTQMQKSVLGIGKSVKEKIQDLVNSK
ncbi:MAG: hypothetical protein D6748_04580 [Calditrichaeota bacterium]|nr:MAG: hypothetical protein D6748_04580 [Calditrichota bacterium]